MERLYDRFLIDRIISYLPCARFIDHRAYISFISSPAHTAYVSSCTKWIQVLEPYFVESFMLRRRQSREVVKKLRALYRQIGGVVLTRHDVPRIEYEFTPFFTLNHQYFYLKLRTEPLEHLPWLCLAYFRSHRGRISRLVGNVIRTYRTARFSPKRLDILIVALMDFLESSQRVRLH